MVITHTYDTQTHLKPTHTGTVYTYGCLTDFIETLSGETNGGQFAGNFYGTVRGKGVGEMAKASGGGGGVAYEHSFSPASFCIINGDAVV